MVELVRDATPLQAGDKALMNRGGQPVMVELGSAAEQQIEIAQPYPNRAAFEAATIADNVTAWRVRAGDMLLSYVRVPTGTANPAIVSANGVLGVPDGKAYPEHWGAPTYRTLAEAADGDDAYDEVAAAYAWVKEGAAGSDKGRRGTLSLRARYYRLEQTFIMDATGVDIDCPRGAVFYIAHTDGAGVWLQASNIDLGFLEVRGDFTRSDTENKANIGVRIEPAIDSASNLITQFDLSRVLIRFHGGSGVVANSMSGLNVMGTRINRCKRHGLVICNYAETDRTGARSTGMVDIGENIRIDNCDGHRVLVGNSAGVGTASAYRINVYNIDGDFCGTNKSILVEDTTDFIRADNVNIMGGAFPTEGMAAGITLAGRVHDFSGSIRITNGGTATAHAVFIRQYSTTNRTQSIRIGNFSHIGLGPSTASVNIGSGVDANQVIIENLVPINAPLLENLASAHKVVNPAGVNISGTLTATTYAGAGAQVNNTAGRLNPTIGPLMRVGGFIGGNICALWPNSSLDNVEGVGAGLYRTSGDITNRPGNFSGVLVYLPFSTVASLFWMIYADTEGNLLYRSSTGGAPSSPTWGAWQTVDTV